MATYQERKDRRTADFADRVGRKLVTCVACGGSGRYDNRGSPRCGACDGAGRVREEKPSAAPVITHWRASLEQQTALKTGLRQQRQA